MTLPSSPNSISLKQIQTELKDGAGTNISAEIYLRVIHNINIQSGSSYPGFSNSNTLAFIDSFQVRSSDSTTVATITNNLSATATSTTTAPDKITGFTSSECILYAPNGLPAILNLNRAGGYVVIDKVELSWAVRLEITVNPDEE